MGLLERCTEEVGCTYLSDLRYLDTEERFRLAGAVEQIAPGEYSLAEWNDALTTWPAGPPPPRRGRQSSGFCWGLPACGFRNDDFTAAPHTPGGGSRRGNSEKGSSAL